MRNFLSIFMVLLLAACSSATEEANRYYRSGMALLEKGGKQDLVAATEEFRNALEIKKSLTPALYGLSLVAEKQGNLAETYKYLRQVVEREPNHLQAQVRLARILLGAGQVEEAAEISAKVLTNGADDPSAQVLRAAVLLKQGKREAAIEQAGKVLEAHAGNAEALEFLAAERMQAGDYAKAIDYAEQALAAQNDLIPLLVIKVQALENTKQADAAEATLRRLIVLQPDNQVFRDGLIQLLVRHGREAAAEAELRAVAARNPADLKARLDVVRFLRSTRGDEIARAELENLIRREPANYEFKFALAGMLHEQNSREAEALIHSVVKDAGGDSKDGIKAQGILAGMMLRNGDRKAAAALIEEILAKDERNEQALILKASMALDKNRIEQAIADLRSVLHEVPDSARALTLLAKAHEMQGLLDLAEDYHSRAFQAGRMEVPYGLAYAEFLMRRGQSARAEKFLNDLLKSNPGNLSALGLLAQTKSNQGDWSGAREVVAEMRRRNG